MQNLTNNIGQKIFFNATNLVSNATNLVFEGPTAPQVAYFGNLASFFSKTFGPSLNAIVPSFKGLCQYGVKTVWEAKAYVGPKVTEGFNAALFFGRTFGASVYSVLPSFKTFASYSVNIVGLTLLYNATKILLDNEGKYSENQKRLVYMATFAFFFRSLTEDNLLSSLSAGHRMMKGLGFALVIDCMGLKASGVVKNEEDIGDYFKEGLKGVCYMGGITFLGTFFGASLMS